MKLALVYNPRLAPRRMARVQRLGKVLEQRGHTVTHHFGDDFVLARDASHCDCLVLAGGDGTARLVIGNQPDPAALPPIAIYPTGTINLLARELGYSPDPEAFAKRLEYGGSGLATRLATIDDMPFLACASIGFDAHTVANVSEDLKLRIGRLAYVVALLRQLKSWPRTPVRIDSGTEQLEAEALFVLRGRYYAGPWALDPGAHLAAEKLRVLALPRARRRDMLLLGLYAMLGSRWPKRDWRFFEAERLVLSGGDGAPVQADGDVIAQTPVSIAMTETRLRFL